MGAIHKTGARVTLNRTEASEWSSVLGERFNAITSLPLGWDGYKGKPVSFTCARFAAQILERLYDPNIAPPSLVPGSDGTLQIEWHINQYDVELDVQSPYNIVATRYNCSTERLDEIEIHSDLTIIAQWVGELTPSISKNDFPEVA